jgi:hypothetical protein
MDPVPVPPVAVKVNVEPKVIVDAEVTVTAVWVAPEIVPHLNPIRSRMPPT